MRIKLVKKVLEAKGTKSFFWDPESKVDFLPGQYYYYTLPKLDFPDPRGETRHFTISSSPTEGKLLRLTTRIREESGFKKTLDALPIGTTIEGEGPTGTLIIDEKEVGPHIFIAGGIGITPFRCAIKYAIDAKIKTPIYLIYSNSDSEFVFKKELDAWQKENDFLKIEYFDSSVSGHLDQSKIEKIIGKWKMVNEKSFTWWVIGPPAFNDAIEDVLEKMKIDSDHIRSEKFTGY
jgi:ferredoxin-NADP reductase